MSSIAISGDTSGAVSIAAPAIAGTNTMTLVAGTGTLAPRVRSTAVASTSGTSVDFTNIPSWVTRITIMLSDISTNGSSVPIIQLGSGSFATSGYLGAASNSSSTSGANYTTGAGIFAAISASSVARGLITAVNITGNAWIIAGNAAFSDAAVTAVFSSSISLSGALDRVRITTVGGTDTFDAGTINIMYE